MGIPTYRFRTWLPLVVLLLPATLVGQAPIFTDRVGPPHSLQGLWDKSDAVLLGTITAVGRPSVSAYTTTVRVQSFRIDDVYKGTPETPIGTILPVEQSGSIGSDEFVRGMQDVVVGDEPSFVKDEEMILFLHRDRFGTYSDVAGGAFRVEHDVIDVPDADRVVMPEFAKRTTMPLDEFVQMLRKLKR